MTLGGDFKDIPPGMVATVVTHLEMTTPPPKAAPLPGGLRLQREETPNIDWYRDLFRTVGEPWLWFSRLKLDDAALNAILNDPAVEIVTLRRGDDVVGFYEMRFGDAETCELSFFGLVPDETGRGAGRAMMGAALAHAWSRPIKRLILHTCTFDSPAALPFYLRSGFTPTARETEIVPDPRLSGLLARDAAPHVPVIE